MTQASLESYVDQLTQADDVFQPEFLSGIIFVGADKSEVTITPDVLKLLDLWGTRWTNFVPTESLDEENLLAGPYIVASGWLWQVLRLYDDTQGAFMVSIKPISDLIHE